MINRALIAISLTIDGWLRFFSTTRTDEEPIISENNDISEIAIYKVYKYIKEIDNETIIMRINTRWKLRRSKQ